MTQIQQDNLTRLVAETDGYITQQTLLDGEERIYCKSLVLLESMNIDSYRDATALEREEYEDSINNTSLARSR